MVTRQDIQATCDDIVREFAPLQVVLFGSYAYGTPTAYSDVDLLVVMEVPKSETRRQAAEIQGRIPERFRLDLLVRSPEEIAYRLSHNDWFLREISEKGIVLYEAIDYAVRPPKNEKGTMNPLTTEWIEKAESDYEAAEWLQQAPTPNHEAVCFHLQQCIEKYLKASLQEANIPIPRTHDLKELLDLIVPIMPTWHTWAPALSKLSKHAVKIRYPGDSATADDTEYALRICNEVRQAGRTHLKFPEK